MLYTEGIILYGKIVMNGKYNIEEGSHGIFEGIQLGRLRKIMKISGCSVPQTRFKLDTSQIQVCNDTAIA
jgi:hypothetical protein